MSTPPDSYLFDRAFSNGQSKLPSLFETTSQPSAVKTTLVIAGADEVGRGPLAGPVVAAAVILPESPLIFGLRDSKVVPVEQREALYCEIQDVAIAYHVAVVDIDMIDSMNILGASLYAIRQCLDSLSVRPDLALIDGNQKAKSTVPERAIIKGDGLSAAIMAASILAKVTRDHIMTEEHEKYPVYGFDEHKGYACEKHLEAIRRHGPSPIHRRSFDPVRSMLGDNVSLFETTRR